jgi:hypothetical protein
VKVVLVGDAEALLDRLSGTDRVVYRRLDA